MCGWSRRQAKLGSLIHAHMYTRCYSRHPAKQHFTLFRPQLIADLRADDTMRLRHLVAARRRRHVVPTTSPSPLTRLFSILHVPLLDVLPLPLPTALVPRLAAAPRSGTYASVYPVPNAIRSGLENTAALILAFPLHYHTLAGPSTYSSVANAPRKMTPRKPVFRRMTVLQWLLVRLRAG